MKLLRNLLIATTAVAAMSATAAFADATATYTDGSVAVTGVDTSVFGDQVTVVIVSDPVVGTVDESEIYYINQADQDGIDDILEGMGMKELTSADGTNYEVWIGGSDVSETNPIIKIDFATASSVKIGDANLDSIITADDASKILDVIAGNDAFATGGKDAADANQDTIITADDASKVLDVIAGNDNF